MAGLDHLAVDRGHDLQRFLVHAGDHLGDPLQRVLPVAGVDPLGGIADLEVASALHAGSALDHGHADVFGDAGVDGGLVDDDRPLLQVPAEGLTGADKQGQVRLARAVNGRGHRDNVEVRLTQVRLVTGELDLRLLKFRSGHLAGSVGALAQLANAVGIDVETDHLGFSAERNHKGQTHVSQPDDGHAAIHLELL